MCVHLTGTLCVCTRRRDCIPVHGHWLQHVFDSLVALAGRMVFAQLVLQSSDSPHDGQPVEVRLTQTDN